MTAWHEREDWEGDDAELSRDLEAERRAPGPGPAQRERMAADLRARLAVAEAPAPAARGRVVRWARRGGVGLGLTLVAAGLAAAAGGWVMLSRSGSLDREPPVAPETSTPEAAPVRPPADRVPRPEPARPEPPSLPTEASSPPALVQPGPVARVAASERPPGHGRTTEPRTAIARSGLAEGGSPPDEDAPVPRPPAALERERALLSAGRAALRSGDVAEARRAAAAHAEAFPSGQLVEARGLLEIQILVHEGRRAAAREAAAQFRRRYPDSLFGPALEDALRMPSEGSSE